MKSKIQENCKVVQQRRILQAIILDGGCINEQGSMFWESSGFQWYFEIQSLPAKIRVSSFITHQLLRRGPDSPSHPPPFERVLSTTASYNISHMLAFHSDDTAGKPAPIQLVTIKN